MKVPEITRATPVIHRMNPVGYFTPDIRSHFSIHNLPFGIAKFKTSLSHDNISESIVRAVTAYGDYAIDLAALVEIGLLQDVAQNVFEQVSYLKYTVLLIFCILEFS